MPACGTGRERARPFVDLAGVAEGVLLAAPVERGAVTVEQLPRRLQSRDVQVAGVFDP
ncbi:hypothetical protein [Pseudonocardia alni]|uniref:hypothetical protein n=1 Tax=Pseudonocardia alni TaxID=33907 RepID=UPI0031DE6041